MEEVITELIEIPPNWVKCQIKEITKKSITKGSTPTSYGFEYKTEGISFVKTENINLFGQVEKSNQYIDSKCHDFLKRSQLADKDLLFSIAGTIGRVGRVNAEILPANTNQALAIIKGDWNNVDNAFMFYYLRSPIIQKEAEHSVVGVGRANLSLTDIGDFTFLLPPFKEQYRIVAKIEELFTKLDEGVKELRAAKAQIKRYRQSVLKHAFEGKLTEEWRKKNSAGSEPASVLLERIKVERKKALGSKYQELPTVDTTDLPELPEGWVWARLDSIWNVISGNAFKSQDFVESGVPVVKIGNVGYGQFVWKDQEYFPFERFEEVKDFEIFGGDLIFALTRPITNNQTKVCLYPTDSIKGLLNQRVAVIRTKESDFKNYLLYYFQSEDFKKAIKLLFSETLQPNLSPIDLKSVEIPVTAIFEVKQVVSEIERHFSVADAAEKAIDESLLQAERLRQSILKQAFEGKLVPQDPTDEPASVLLERIKAEREAKKVNSEKVKSEKKEKKELKRQEQQSEQVQIKEAKKRKKETKKTKKLSKKATTEESSVVQT